MASRISRREGGQYTLRIRLSLRLPLRVVALAAVILPVAWPARPAAHEIPADVLVRAFVRPEGSTLRVLLRVPLATMRDMNFPVSGPGYLDLARSAGLVRDGAELWIANSLALYEGDVRLAGRLVAARVSLPSDPSFQSFGAALATVTGPPLPPETTIIWNQAVADLLFEYPIASDRSRFSIHASFARLGLRVVTVLRLLTPDGPERAFELAGDAGLVRLDPSWLQAVRLFVALGFRHILDGADHLLFVLCLVLPFRRLRELVLIVTAFTVAHSITLLAAAFGYGPDGLWFPPFIETLIAVSILYMALENVIGLQAVRRRWVITFAFGLVHGFGFSFALQHTLQFAGSHLVTSLFAFNLGVELGQVLVVALLIPALALAFRYVVAERLGIVIVSAFVAHTAWHWMTERWAALRGVEWPALTAAGAAGAIRWLMALVILSGIVWLVAARLSRTSEAGATSPDRAP